MKKEFELEQYQDRIRSSSCLFCALANHAATQKEHYIYEDEFAMVVLDRYPTQNGYCLVFPKQHLEHTSNLSEATFLQLQSLVHKTIRAVKIAMGAERVYTACLGSQLLTPHIHYHVAPIPAGLPLEEQQWEALDKSQGIIDYSEREFDEVANKIAKALNGLGLSKVDQ